MSTFFKKFKSQMYQYLNKAIVGKLLSNYKILTLDSKAWQTQHLQVFWWLTIAKSRKTWWLMLYDDITK